MSKYIYLYRGPVTPMEQMTEEQGAEQLAAWNKWIEGVGSAMVDVGLPFGSGAAVSDDGSAGEPGDLNGYTIVEADSLDAAKGLASDHPFLSEGKGRFAIDVYELVPIPGM